MKVVGRRAVRHLDVVGARGEHRDWGSVLVRQADARRIVYLGEELRGLGVGVRPRAEQTDDDCSGGEGEEHAHRSELRRLPPVGFTGRNVRSGA